MKLFGFLLGVILVDVALSGEGEEKGKQFINEVYKQIEQLGAEKAAKEWAADTADKAHKVEATKEANEAKNKYKAYLKESFDKMKTFPWDKFDDENTKRMFFAASHLGSALLSDDKKAELDKVYKDMNNINRAALLKEFNGGDEPKLKLTDVESKVRRNFKNFNADEMAFYWKETHDTLGKPKKDMFTSWMELETEVAKLNGYDNVAKYFQSAYEVDDIENKMQELYTQQYPLFKELHAYIRFKLWDAYGRKDNIVNPKGPIPASLLGTKWGEGASSLYSLLEPYPDKPSLVISQKLKDEYYTGKIMAETAEEYFQNLGLSIMNDDFWDNSIFEKNKDISVSGKTYYFDNGNFCRLIFPATLTTGDFSTMHVLFGILEYEKEAGNLPYFFRKPPGLAFSSAFQNMIDLLTKSPNYYKTLGLLDSKIELDKQLEINTLLKRALTQVFYYPWAYTYDRWRWEVSEGKISKDNYNCQYWKLRADIQGVEPPVDRDNNDFDIGVDVWYTTGGEYMPQYIGDILKYDMIRALCNGQTLTFCDINNNKAAGEKLKEMMAIGNSRPWYVALEKLTGQNKLDASALLEYYQPLYEWLQKENEKNKVTPGWIPSVDYRCR